MTDTVSSESPPVAMPADRRTAWIAPRVQTIVAGEAEEGTRMRNPDGQLTTS